MHWQYEHPAHASVAKRCHKALPVPAVSCSVPAQRQIPMPRGSNATLASSTWTLHQHVFWARLEAVPGWEEEQSRAGAAGDLRHWPPALGVWPRGLTSQLSCANAAMIKPCNKDTKGTLKRLL